LIRDQVLINVGAYGPKCCIFPRGCRFKYLFKYNTYL